MAEFERKKKGQKPVRVQTDNPIERVRLLADGYVELTGSKASASGKRAASRRSRSTRKTAEPQPTPAGDAK